MQKKKTKKQVNKVNDPHVRPIIITNVKSISKWTEFKYAVAENTIVHFIFSMLNRIGYWLFIIPAIPFICLKHYFTIVYNAYKELYYIPEKWLRYGEFFNFHTHFKIFYTPQTTWLLKLCSFYHQDKPELLEDIMLNAFESWYYDENGKNEYLNPEIKKTTQKIANQIKQYRNVIQNKNHNFEKALKTRKQLALKIWDIKEHLWT